jgi:nucleoside-triphosphatase THEP1
LTVSRNDIDRYFSVNDVVVSGGGRRRFRIIEILDDKIRIQPTKSATASRLKLDKLTVVIENIECINSDRIEATVGKVLNQHGLRDTQNESYLYGMAK